jgi:peptidoglycan/LPS O-acetylase OafA/YrhL
MRVKELDGLRGIAVLSVICVHYFDWFPLPALRHGWFANLLLMPVRFILLLPRSGALGVMLFFVLSGYLITTILLNLRNKEHYFGVFYARRAFRILPPYLLGMMVYIGSSFALGKPGSWGLWLRYIFYYSSLLPNQPRELSAHPPLVPAAVFGGLLVLWSLSVEELYYTFWAPVVRYVSEKELALLIATMIIMAPPLRYLLNTPLHDNEWHSFYCNMDGLACGSAVALLMRARGLNPAKWLRTEKLFDRLCVAMVASTVVFYVLGNYGLIGSRLVFALGLLLANLSFALIVYRVLRNSGREQLWLRSLRAPWLRSVGKVSYSLYLFHLASLLFVQSLLSHLPGERHVTFLFGLLLGLLLSFGVAYGLWYALESPILNWKDRLVPSSSPEFALNMKNSVDR